MGQRHQVYLKMDKGQGKSGKDKSSIFLHDQWLYSHFALKMLKQYLTYQNNTDRPIGMSNYNSEEILKSIYSIRLDDGVHKNIYMMNGETDKEYLESKKIFFCENDDGITLLDYDSEKQLPVYSFMFHYEKYREDYPEDKWKNDIAYKPLTANEYLLKYNIEGLDYFVELMKEKNTYGINYFKEEMEYQLEEIPKILDYINNNSIYMNEDRVKNTFDVYSKEMIKCKNTDNNVSKILVDKLQNVCNKAVETLKGEDLELFKKYHKDILNIHNGSLNKQNETSLVEQSVEHMFRLSLETSGMSDEDIQSLWEEKKNDLIMKVCNFTSEIVMNTVEEKNEDNYDDYSYQEFKDLIKSKIGNDNEVLSERVSDNGNKMLFYVTEDNKEVKLAAERKGESYIFVDKEEEFNIDIENMIYLQTLLNKNKEFKESTKKLVQSQPSLFGEEKVESTSLVVNDLDVVAKKVEETKKLNEKGLLADYQIDMLNNNEYHTSFTDEGEKFYMVYNEETSYMLLNTQLQRLDRQDYYSSFKIGKELLKSEIEKQKEKPLISLSQKIDNLENDVKDYDTEVDKFNKSYGNRDTDKEDISNKNKNK